MSENTVVVIDDTVDNLVTAQNALTAHGVKVFTANNGVAGLKLIKEMKPSVVLLDIRMPVVSGWDTYHAIRNDALIQHTPIIAITAPDADKTPFLEAGFQAVIYKPLTAEALWEGIQALVK